MKTPSFNELEALVEYFSDELKGAQLQEVHASVEGLVLVFYRFVKTPKTVYVVFDLDVQFPFVGLYYSHPWPHLKKTKPVGLFLNSHGKNLILKDIELLPRVGRVVQFALGESGPGYEQTFIEFRLIPKQGNLIVRKEKKSISWYPVKALSQMQPHEIDNQTAIGNEVRSIPFMLNSWLERRGIGKKAAAVQTGQSPYEKWKAQKQKDLRKKQNALIAIESQIKDFLEFPWMEMGQHLKTYGTNQLKNEWHQHLNFEISVSKNIQICFAKAKAAKIKISGAQKRLLQIQSEIAQLADLSEDVFAAYLRNGASLRQHKSIKSARTVEGRFRKMVLEPSGIICYMGKSAKDNLNLLRKAKAWDMWIHLKDYPSAHAIMHLQKGQAIPQNDLRLVSEWLVKENFKDKMSGTKYAVVYVECRHVRPLKGDKLGRVTYHEGRELLIAL